MKLRDSGMPDETYWESLFDVGLILSKLGIDSTIRDVAEFGSGYGTFTLPIAQRVGGTVYTFDIDDAMVERTRARAREASLTNVVCEQRDIMQQGFGLHDRSVDAALLFNILHCHDPVVLLGHAADAARKSGTVLVIHWRYDSATPRGPSLIIRPRPEQIVQWASETSRLTVLGEVIDLPPWHYGIRFQRI